MSEGEHRFPFEAEPAEIGLGPEFVRKVTVEAVIEKRVHQIYLRTKARSAATFECDRCLDPFTKDLEASYTILYVTEAQPEEGENEGPEVQVISPDTNMIDLDEDVRQYLVLAIPPKLLCSDDCKGLCPSCGVNRNHVACSCRTDAEDPRWDALREISGN